MNECDGVIYVQFASCWIYLVPVHM